MIQWIESQAKPKSLNILQKASDFLTDTTIPNQNEFKRNPFVIAFFFIAFTFALFSDNVNMQVYRNICIVSLDKTTINFSISSSKKFQFFPLYSLNIRKASCKMELFTINKIKKLIFVEEMQCAKSLARKDKVL